MVKFDSKYFLICDLNKWYTVFNFNFMYISKFNSLSRKSRLPN